MPFKSQLADNSDVEDKHKSYICTDWHTEILLNKKGFKVSRHHNEWTKTLETLDGFKKCSDELNLHQEKIFQAIYPRLNEIHNLSLPETYWRKLFGLGWIRFITLTYDFFQRHIDLTDHTIEIRTLNLNEIPSFSTFEEFRNTIQFSSQGNLILGSLLEKSVPNKFITIKTYFQESPQSKSQATLQRRSFLSKVVNANRAALRRICYKRSPQILIAHAYFSKRNEDRLVFKSWGRIQPIRPELDSSFKIENQLISQNEEMRDFLVKDFSEITLWDSFLKNCIKQLMPNMFLEEFSKFRTKAKNILQQYPDLKIIVSESWTGDSTNCLLLAEAHLQGTRHFYNEHNCITHIFSGSHVDLTAGISDKYLTLGWEPSPSLEQFAIQKASSLFEFAKAFPRKSVPNKYIAYVSGALHAKREVLNAFYSTSAEFAEKLISFEKIFFDAIDTDILQDLQLREYPAKFTAKWLTVSPSQYLSSIKNSKLIQLQKDDVSAGQFMAESSLIVLNYISTSFLEAIAMNKPVIIFRPQGTYFINSQYKTLMDGLEHCGMIQNDPEKAAHFIKSIWHKPQEWWNSREIVEAKKEIFKLFSTDHNILTNILLNELR